ncbi:MAG TPA: hypothetical protein VMV77_16220 [Bacteroidales bacterium]|nr:hypothetical protein [Bacteroidales bacterium]
MYKTVRDRSDPIEINYGEGNCDAVATVTSGGESKEIQLRFRHRTMLNN